VKGKLTTQTTKALGYKDIAILSPVSLSTVPANLKQLPLFASTVPLIFESLFMLNLCYLFDYALYSVRP
jgi:hypothetical protein